MDPQDLEGLKHSGEFLRCIIELDTVGIRRLWHHVAPTMPQPRNHEEALLALHMARVKTPNVPRHLRVYSQQWLAEHLPKRGEVFAVGVAVKAPPHRMDRAMDIREAMSDSVMDSYLAGIDLNQDAPEVKTRMLSARARVGRFARAVLGHRVVSPGGSA